MKAAWVAAAGAAGVFCINLLAFRHFVADDAYITARYARNLVEWGELTFNRGEQISALTSPLHALVDSGIYALAGTVIGPYRVLSVVLCVATLALAAWSMRRDGAAVAIFCAVTAASPFMTLWTLGGLETPLVLVLLTALTLLARRIAATGPATTGQLLTSGVLIGLAFLARFDTIVYAAPVGLYIFCSRGNRATALRWMSPGAILALGWLVFSQIYYHDILPTSFYTKRPRIDAAALAQNATYLTQFLLLSALILLVVPAARRSAGQIIRQRWGIYLGLVSFLAYAMTTATHHMMFSYRMLVPMLPTMAMALLDLRAADRVRRDLAITMACLALQIPTAWYVLNRGMNVGIRGEYQHDSLRSYAEQFMPALEATADELQRDWERRGTARPPRLRTLTAGALPYRLPKAYVLEVLVSYRHRCKPVTEDLADYIHLITPLHGTIEQQLGRRAGRGELVSEHAIYLEGTPQRMLLFFCPDPQPNVLPGHIDLPCKN